MHKIIKKIWRFFCRINTQIKDILENFKYYFYNYHISYLPIHKCRLFYLKNILRYKIGSHSFIHLGCFFLGSKITIGNNTVIGRNCNIIGEIIIGDNCSISAFTIIQSVSHNKDSPTFEGKHEQITIGNYVWVGIKAVILLGVTIGDCAIIGANSTITKNVPECKVFAGSPAKEISERSRSACVYTLDYHPPFN